MGLIARLLSFTRAQRNAAYVSDAKVDPGGGANLSAPHFSAPGDDSQPLPGDYVFAVPAKRSGSAAAVGYLDPVNEPKAGPGDKRVYARNADGAIVGELWLKSSGDIELTNGAATLTLKASGAVELKGASFDWTTA